jgi:hypothetical protein
MTPRRSDGRSGHVDGRRGLEDAIDREDEM